MVVGVGVTLIPAWLQSRCQLPTGPGIVASCQSYTRLHPLGLFHSRAGCRIFSKRCRLCDEPDTTPLVSRPRRSERFSTNTAIRLPSPYECHLPPRPQHHRLAIRLFDGMLMTVDATYPAHLLACELAPPFAGEGPFALWHFSEDPSLGLFDLTFQRQILTRSRWSGRLIPATLPCFGFRGNAPGEWHPVPDSTTTDEDRELFFGQSVADRLHVMESDWLPQMKACSLYAYRLPHGILQTSRCGRILGLGGTLSRPLNA